MSASSNREVALLDIGGPVGAGKTSLVAELLPRLDGLDTGVLTVGSHREEDAAVLRRRLDGTVPEELVAAAGSGPPEGDLSTAIEDRVTAFADAHPGLDLVVVESDGVAAAGDGGPGEHTGASGGGESGETTVGPADLSVYVISVAAGDDVPRKRTPGVVECDLLVVNKTDLAAHVGADLGTIERDARTVRDGPFVFTNCKTGEGVDSVAEQVRRRLLVA
jgi:urease accessory protein